MTSGRKKQPELISCERCGKTAEWKGGRKRRFCSPTCASGSRYTPKLKRPRTSYQETVREKERRHRALARQAKIDCGSCVDCGMEINERTVICIDFDHRDPDDKAFTISYEVGRVTDEQLLAEIAKCDAVCRNCHAYRTHDNQHHLRPGNDNPIRRPQIQASAQIAFEF